MVLEETGVDVREGLVESSRAPLDADAKASDAEEGAAGTDAEAEDAEGADAEDEEGTADAKAIADVDADKDTEAVADAEEAEEVEEEEVDEDAWQRPWYPPTFAPREEEELEDHEVVVEVDARVRDAAIELLSTAADETERSELRDLVLQQLEAEAAKRRASGEEEDLAVEAALAEAEEDDADARFAVVGDDGEVEFELPSRAEAAEMDADETRDLLESLAERVGIAPEAWRELATPVRLSLAAHARLPLTLPDPDPSTTLRWSSRRCSS